MYALRANFFILIRNLRIKAIKITIFLTINISWMNNNFVVGLEVYSTNFESGDHLVIKSLKILVNNFLLSRDYFNFTRFTRFARSVKFISSNLWKRKSKFQWISYFSNKLGTHLSINFQHFVHIFEWISNLFFPFV